MINFRRTGVEADNLLQLQLNTEQAFKQVNEEPFVKGKLVTVIATSTAQFDIKTGFGRSVQGWVMTDTTAAVRFYRVVTDLDSAGVLTLKPDATGTFKFWVF